MKTERLFYPDNNPMDIKTASTVAGELLSLSTQQLAGIAIKNGHSRVEIPAQTLDKIKLLHLGEQRRIKEALTDALQDASGAELIIEKQLPPYFSRYFSKSS